MSILSNRVVVVTGGTRGIGYAIASACAAAGASVVVSSRSQGTMDEAVSRLRADGYTASGIAADARSLEQMRALADHTVAAFGKFDTWFNNAGIAGPYGPTLDLDPAAFNQVIQTNILGVYYGSLVAMRHFLPRRSGKLVNLLGHGSKGPLPWQNAYGSSKGWVRNFTLALAAETKGSGVGVFTYNPGMVRTALLTRIDAIEGMQERLKVFPTVVRFLAKPPEEVAKMAVWLASPATDGMTGRVITYPSTGTILRSMSGELSRILMKRPLEDVNIETRFVPPYCG